MKRNGPWVTSSWPSSISAAMRHERNTERLQTEMATPSRVRINAITLPTTDPGVPEMKPTARIMNPAVAIQPPKDGWAEAAEREAVGPLLARTATGLPFLAAAPRRMNVPQKRN